MAELHELYSFETVFENAVASIVTDAGLVVPNKQRDSKELPTPRVEVQFQLGEDTNHYTTAEYNGSKRIDTWNAAFMLSVVTDREKNEGKKDAKSLGYDEHARIVSKLRDLMADWQDLFAEELTYHAVCDLRYGGATPRVEADESHDVTEMRFNIVFRIVNWQPYCVGPTLAVTANGVEITGTVSGSDTAFDISPAFPKRAVVDQYELYSGAPLVLGPFLFDYELRTQDSAAFVMDDLLVINGEVLGAQFPAGSVITYIPKGETCEINVRDNFATEIGINDTEGNLILRCSQLDGALPATVPILEPHTIAYFDIDLDSIGSDALCITLQKLNGNDWENILGWEGITNTAVDQAARDSYNIPVGGAGKYRLVAINAKGRGAISNVVTIN